MRALSAYIVASSFFMLGTLPLDQKAVAASLNATALDAGDLGSTITPATPGDPVVHHHKAYAKTTYGISCPGDRVVWVNTNSGVYHLEGERWFGRTASGDYECEKAAKAEGDRETRNGQ